MAAAKGSGPTTSISPATGAAKKPRLESGNQDSGKYASFTESQGDLHQIHTPGSFSGPLRGALHPSFTQLPTEIWEMITSASQQQHLPSQDKEIEDDCIANKHCDAPNLGHDFILFDDSTKPRFSKNRRGDCLYHDDDIDYATEKQSQLTPHLQRSPPPRPRRLLTPDFSNDEEPTNFFEPLDTVEHRRRQSRIDLRCKEEWTPLF